MAKLLLELREDQGPLTPEGEECATAAEDLLREDGQRL
jgi:hypothetical protein